jgi:hypothetical protein
MGSPDTLPTPAERTYRPVLVVTNFSDLETLGRQNTYYARLCRCAEHLDGNEDDGMWLHFQYIPPGAVFQWTISHIMEALTDRVWQQWELHLQRHQIQFYFENLQGDDQRIEPDNGILELLATFRPDWQTRQYSVDNSVDHPNPFIPFVMRLTGMRMGVHNSNT